MFERRFKQVDVFAERLGRGNPVAVVLDAEDISDEEIKRFAAWTNLSETTFVLPPTEPSADYRVRILTPTEELPFAGHPTIGTCHAWREAGGIPKASDGSIVQQCDAGLVTLKQIDGRLAFATPPMTRSGPVDAAFVEHVLDVLEVTADQVAATAWVDNGPGWVGVLLHSVDVLRSLQPTIPPTKLDIGVAARTGNLNQSDANQSDAALEVRAFFNAGGSREDPVTGSLNGSLAQWLIGTGRISAPYIASQGTALGRDGRVFLSQDDNGQIWVGGDAVTGIDGSVRLP